MVEDEKFTPENQPSSRTLWLRLQTLLSDKISSLPTFVLLSPEGKELNRREGFVGEVDFYKGFLDCSNVLKPKQ